MRRIHIVAEMRLNPGCREELEPVFREMIESSRAEPGNISYDLMESLDDPNHLFVIETWASQAAIDEHNASGHFRKFSQTMEGKRKESRVTKLVECGANSAAAGQ